MNHIKYFIIVSILFSFLTAVTKADAEEVMLNASEGVAIDASVSLLEDGRFHLIVDEDQIQSIDGMNVKKYKKKWQKIMEQNNEIRSEATKEVFEELWKGRDKGVKIEKEWSFIQGMGQSQIPGLLPGVAKNKKSQKNTLKKKHLYRKSSDNKHQTVLEFLNYEDGFIIFTKHLLLILDDGEYQLVNSIHNIHSGASLMNISKSFADSDRDGSTDEEELCEHQYLDFFETDEDLFIGCVSTDPNNNDSDGDGWWDGFEKSMAADPNDPKNIPDKAGFTVGQMSNMFESQIINRVVNEVESYE